MSGDARDEFERSELEQLGLGRLHPSWSCPHLETTEPDAQGYVICNGCLSALRRPLNLSQLIDRMNRNLRGGAS